MLFVVIVYINQKKPVTTGNEQLQQDRAGLYHSKNSCMELQKFRTIICSLNKNSALNNLRCTK